MKVRWPRTDRVALIGHLTRDRNLVLGRCTTCAGGTVHYAGIAYAELGLRVSVLTKVAHADEDELTAPLRRAGADIHVLKSARTTCFENSVERDLRERRQRVFAVADAFEIADIPEALPAVVHLGPLTSREMSVEFIVRVARQARCLVLDLQGSVRELRGEQIVQRNWSEARDVLPACGVVKADADEARLITGQEEPELAARALHDWGASEVLLTLAERGSYVAASGKISYIPPCAAPNAIDSTGAGDTYTAAYVGARMRGESVTDAARFASGVASLSVEGVGPFACSLADVQRRLQASARAT